ncbi:MAG: polymer-forming cytoskeletal protein [Deltaproteobacteria bacterium]|nr:polymer-forming cytoskeletal protein [Deltaproteobacteria bacterium]
MKKPTKDIQMLGPQMTLEGSLVFEGTMIMNGHVKGTIESKDGTIVVGEKAVIHADVFVCNATISGEVKGTVRATERIELHPPARVYGDLSAPVVLIDAGVTFDGKCTTAPKDKTAEKAGEILEKLPEGTAKLMKSLGRWRTPSGSSKGGEEDAGLIEPKVN